MGNYYTAKILTSAGKKVQRDFFVPSEREVISEIAQEMGVPLKIRRKSQGGWNRQYISKRYKMSFLRAINLRTQGGGKSAENALLEVIQNETHRKKRAELEPALHILKGGGTFGDAISQLGMFDRPTVAILKSGVTGGFVKESLKLAMQYIEAKKKVWARIMGGLIWLVVDVLSVVTTPPTVQYYVIPLLRRGMNSSDPAVLAKYNAKIDSLALYNGLLMWISIIATVFLGAVVIAFFLKGKPKDWAEKIALKLPILRSVLLDGALADTMNIVGKMLSAKVPFIVACHSATEATMVPAVKTFWSGVAGKIHFGVTKALTSSAILSPAEKQIIGGHQDSDQLAEVFTSIAEDRNESYDRGISKMWRLGILVVMVYFIVVVAICLAANLIQGEGMDMALKGLQGGGF